MSLWRWAAPGSESCRSSLDGHDKELGFYPNYGRTHEVNEIPHVNIRTVPATCAGSLDVIIELQLLFIGAFIPQASGLPIRHESQRSPFLSSHK